MNDLKKCWEMLPKVSRSFSLCIALLPKPINSRMMLSYLIFRTIDTIEDSTIGIKTKKDMFDAFLDTISQDAYDHKKAIDCRKQLLKKLTYSYEFMLLKDLDAMLRVFYSTPKDERLALLRQAKQMAQGMYRFQKRSIDTFKDQDEYAFYVAGVVGYIFNDLFYYNGVINNKKREHLKGYAKRYGLGLQKVNMIRDLCDDIPKRRYFWPKKAIEREGLAYKTICSEKNREKALLILDEMIKNAVDYLNDGLYYVMSLPRKHLRVRVFCLIPLFMALESFIKCINNENVFIKGKKVKISKGKVKEIVRNSYLLGWSNFMLKRWYKKTMRRADASYHKPGP